MTTTLDAIYESGKLRLLEPIQLAEGERVQISISHEFDRSREDSGNNAAGSAVNGARTQDQMTVQNTQKWVDEYLTEVNALYEPTGLIETTSIDHDKILYGKNGAR